MLGILGGMGPLATVDFMEKVIRSTSASRDQDHVPMIVSCVPQIPDRTDAIRKVGPAPLPELLRGVVRLETIGATRIVIPCNTAHYWYDDVVKFSRVPVDNIVDVCLDHIRQSEGKTKVGLLATAGTIEGRVYHRRAGDIELETLDEVGMNASMEAIRAVKQGSLGQGREILVRLVEMLRARGCSRVIMACTEIPIALGGVRELEHMLIDPSLVLAQHCVARFVPVTPQRELATI